MSKSKESQVYYKKSSCYVNIYNFPKGYVLIFHKLHRETFSGRMEALVVSYQEINQVWDQDLSLGLRAILWDNGGT